MKKSRKLVLMSLFIAMALALHVFEGMLPIQFGTPGAKLGLANIVTIMMLYLFGFREAFLVVVLRILMGSFFAGGPTGFVYSLAGGMTSLLVMQAVKWGFKKNVSIVGVSIAGAVSHSVGQIVIAILVVQNMGLISYLPILILLSLGTGIFIGYVAKYMLKLLPNHIESLGHYTQP